MQISIR